MKNMRLQKSGLVLLMSCLPFVSWSTHVSGSTNQVILEKYSDPALITFVRTVVETNPRVQAARAAMDASRALESAAGRPLYNPKLEADYENAVDRTWEVGIGQTLDWNGKRKARLSVAASDRHAIEAEFLATRRDLAVELMSGLTVYQTGVQRDALAVERQRVMREFAELAQRRFDAGDLNQVEAELATLAFVEAQIQRATAAADLAEAKQAVRNLTLTTAPDQWPSVDTQLPQIPTVNNPQGLVMELPEVLAAQRRVDAADARVELREREKRPDPTLSLRGGREDDSTLVGVNLSIPIYIRNSFKYEVSAAVAERDYAQQRVDDLLRHAYARYLSATERYELSRNAWNGWKQTGQISLKRQGDLLQRMWEAGELSTTDFLVQLRQTLDTRESALNLELTMWRAWFEWLAASGQVDKWLGQEESS
jgi:cobalt-zinc-cadmium efflux system outer membrane protein